MSVIPKLNFSQPAAGSGNVTLAVSTQVAKCSVPVTGQGDYMLKDLRIITMTVGAEEFRFLATRDEAQRLADLATRVPGHALRGGNGLMLPGLGRPLS